MEKLQNDTTFLTQMKQNFQQLKLDMPVNANVIEQSEDSTGNYLDNCKDCTHCFDTLLAQDCRYCYDTANAADNMDVYI